MLLGPDGLIRLSPWCRMVWEWGGMEEVPVEWEVLLQDMTVGLLIIIMGDMVVLHMDMGVVEDVDLHQGVDTMAVGMEVLLRAVDMVVEVDMDVEVDTTIVDPQEVVGIAEVVVVALEEGHHVAEIGA